MRFPAFLCAIFLALCALHQMPAGTSRCAARGLPEPNDFPAPARAASALKQPLLVTALEKKYRTEIRRSAAHGPNFAGHYVIARWGCGTGCIQFVIVDLNNGRVFDPAFRQIDYHYPSDPDYDFNWWCYPSALNYSVSSRLLIIEGCLDGHRCGRNYFLMDQEGLKVLSYDPDLSKDGKVAPF